MHRVLGPAWFDEQGRLKRRATRLRMIEDPSFRATLNRILHPHIITAMEREWALWQLRDPEAPILFDVPLLFEGGFEQSFEVIVLVYATPAVQVLRLMDRDGISRLEAEKTLAIQLPIDEKKSRSHLVIDNGGSLEDTQRQVRAAWRKLFVQLDEPACGEPLIP